MGDRASVPGAAPARGDSQRARIRSSKRPSTGTHSTHSVLDVSTLDPAAVDPDELSRTRATRNDPSAGRFGTLLWEGLTHRYITLDVHNA